MNRKKTVRIFCLILALVIILTAAATIISSLTVPVYAAGTTSTINTKEPDGIYNTDSNKLVSYILSKENLRYEFSFTIKNPSSVKSGRYTFYLNNSKPNFFTIKEANVWQTDKNNKTAYLTLDVENESGTTEAVVTGKLYHITHTGRDNGERYITLILNSAEESYFNRLEIPLFIPDNYFVYNNTSTGSGGSSGSSSGNDFVSNIVVENIITTDKKGERIDKVTKDTAPFNLTVTFLDYGMESVDFENIPDRSLSVYMKDGSGFSSNTGKGLGGELSTLVASKDGTPRFKATFTNLMFDDTGSNQISFTVVYDLDNQHYTKDVQVTVKQAKPKEKEEEEDKIAPIKPYIIMSQYSYGKEQIIAGKDFTLTMSFTNTSSVIPLENIVMTVTPNPDYLSISSSSNTIYIPAMAPKATISHSIDLEALPNAKVGSPEVTVEFSYQYVDTVNKKREEGKTTEKISIPLTQIDRFDVDPISEMSDYAIAGEPFYVTVSFINRGKSPTYNISAKVVSKSEVTSASQHFGNLEAGKSDSVELSVTAPKAGELVAEVVVQYEDENTNQKEIATPFSIMINEPYVPNMNDFNPIGDPNTTITDTPTIAPMTIVLCVIGAILIALPIAYYFIKRTKQAESEGFDEDF